MRTIQAPSKTAPGSIFDGYPCRSLFPMYSQFGCAVTCNILSKALAHFLPGRERAETLAGCSERIAATRTTNLEHGPAGQGHGLYRLQPEKINHLGHCVAFNLTQHNGIKHIRNRLARKNREIQDMGKRIEMHPRVSLPIHPSPSPASALLHYRHTFL